MLVVIAYCQKDAGLALKNAKVMAALDRYDKHTLMLACNKTAFNSGLHQEILSVLSPKFGTTLPVFVPYDEDERPWPIAPNHLFRRIAYEIQENVKLDWLFLEADATVTRKGAVDEVEAEYAECKARGKFFMGDGVGSTVNTNAVDHMSGIAVYPWNSIQLAPSINMASMQAWDIYSAKEVLPQVHFTQKIQHIFWRSFNPPIIPTFTDQTSLSLLRENAVIFHRCKDGTLADRLMEKIEGVNPPDVGKVMQGTKEIPLHTPYIYTYHEPVKELDQNDITELIGLWQREWEAAGHIPLVLHESDASKHPMYSAAKTIFSSFPSVNPKGYDYHCFMRWLAVSVKGGGIMADTDLFPKSEAFPSQGAGINFFSGNKIDPRIPCYVVGDKAGYESVIGHFFATKPDEKHWSDMIALRTFDAPVNPIVKEYGDKEWQDAPLIHFPTNRMQPAGKTPKWKYIPELLHPPVSEVPQITPQQPPQTIADMIRSHIDALIEIADGKAGRVTAIRKEIKRLGIGMRGKKGKKK